MTHRTIEKRAAQLVIALGLLIPLGFAAYWVFQKHQSTKQRLLDMEPRHARLLGLDAQRQELDKALLQVQQARRHYFYPAGQDASQAGNEAQNRIRDVFSGAGLQISSSQVLPAKVEKGFDRIGLTVRAEGEWLALQTALVILPTLTPIVTLNDLEVQLLGGPAGGPPRLAAQFNLSVLRER
jgi:general secretion pathway protein M